MPDAKRRRRAHLRKEELVQDLLTFVGHHDSMLQRPNIPSCDVNMAPDLLQELTVFCEQTCRMLSIALILIRSRRPVELDGIQSRIGLICAKALDLPPEQTGLVKLELRRLLREVDCLETALRDQNA